MNSGIPDWIPLSIIIIVVLIVLWWKFKDELLFRFRCIETEGVITNWMAAEEKGKRYYYPLIEYTTRSSVVVTYRAEERCEGEPLYPQGTKVGVCYIPEKPKMVRTTYP